MKVIRWKTITPVVALIVAGLWGVAVVRHIEVEAQDTQSIVGSSPLYSLSEADGWINSKPLSAKELKGKVVLVDFWDYSCINCIRAIPYIRAWAEKYRNSGLVVIGVHTPEFDVEKQVPNVEKTVKKFGITYPVALDGDEKIWNAFHNQYWPAHYFIDARDKVRYERRSDTGSRRLTSIRAGLSPLDVAVDQPPFRSVVPRTILWTSILMLMRGTRRNGVFAISSAYHRRGRSARSRWTRRAVHGREFVNEVSGRSSIDCPATVKHALALGL